MNKHFENICLGFATLFVFGVIALSGYGIYLTFNNISINWAIFGTAIIYSVTSLFGAIVFFVLMHEVGSGMGTILKKKLWRN